MLRACAASALARTNVASAKCRIAAGSASMSKAPSLLFAPGGAHALRTDDLDYLGLPLQPEVRRMVVLRSRLTTASRESVLGKR